MPSQPLESDYFVVRVRVTADSEKLQTYLDHLNTFPEGSAARLEMEGAFFQLLSEYTKGLAERVRATGELTIYDIEST